MSFIIQFLYNQREKPAHCVDSGSDVTVLNARNIEYIFARLCLRR